MQIARPKLACRVCGHPDSATWNVTSRDPQVLSTAAIRKYKNAIFSTSHGVQLEVLWSQLPFEDAGFHLFSGARKPPGQ